ncbi:MAG: DUF1326 domain-containing protein [Planctomycetes bacterium]|nr:DUF1326 domain-containing protein [Planctomycetota bacterium]
MRKSVILVVGCVFAGMAAAAGWDTQEGPAYMIKGQQIEGCECDVYCPCIFQKDATADQCRALMAWKITEGKHGNTDLKGVVFAASVTKSGKNIEKAMGKWEGLIFVSDKSSEEQRKAIADILKREFGGAFAKLEVRTAPIEIMGGSEQYELKMGQIATMKISALKGKNGQVTVIENAPSPLALPKYYCARADVHTYNDGASKWDFAGRNAYYGGFEMKSK